MLSFQGKTGLQGKTILLGVTGSIACYKAAELARLLVKSGAQVRVLMSSNAREFISPLVFETLTASKCYCDTFDRNFAFDVSHVSLAKSADLFIVAPATANFIAKAAAGIADDMITTTFLAATCQKMIAPAMNTAMWDNVATQENIATCKRRGIQFVEPVTGRLACADVGKGKMASPDVILDFAVDCAAFGKDLAGRRFLVTAGPTREPLDPVRFITNGSSGKMGFALARAAAARGAEVTLVTGPVGMDDPASPLVHTVRVVTAEQMAEAVIKHFDTADVVVMAAAVADFRPASYSEHKIKKCSGSLHLDLERTQDILLYLGQHKRADQILCGFSMETENLTGNARQKLIDKNLDLIVANDITQAGAGFACDTNKVTLITRESVKELPLASKEQVALSILDEIAHAL